MNQDAFDRLSESSIPAPLADGRTGDRVSVLAGGVLYVRGGEASTRRGTGSTG
ncbi:MAG: hypothetical protein AB8I08_05705 [Sandaracinaceae bacterium]